MSLAHLILRRQSALAEAVFDALKSCSIRSFYDLSRRAPAAASYSISAIVASSGRTSVLPSLARLAPAALPTSLPSIWFRNWGSIQSSSANMPSVSASFFSLGGVRHASTIKVKPPFKGGKLKPYSAFKDRFKMTATGKIRYMRPGNVHKRHNKGRRQLQDLGETQVMQNTYAKTMKRLGFIMRRF